MEARVSRVMIAEDSPPALDINMPEIGGIDTLRAIRSIDPSVKVIMMSGQIDLDRSKESIARGAFDYITKPFGLHDLAEALEAEGDRGLWNPQILSEFPRVIHEK